MNSEEFLTLMNYPEEWVHLGMANEELLAEQMRVYKPGDEEASGFYRFGHFVFWIERNPTKKELLKLATLSFVDPDQQMANDVRRAISEADSCDADVLQLLQSGGAN